MSIEVTIRHMPSHEDLRLRAEEESQALMDEFPRTEHVHVILDHEKHLFKAEVLVQAGHHVRLEAVEEVDNMHVALERAFDKVRRQYRRLLDRVKDHHVATRHELSKRDLGETP